MIVMKGVALALEREELDWCRRFRAEEAEADRLEPDRSIANAKGSCGSHQRGHASLQPRSGDVVLSWYDARVRKLGHEDEKTSGKERTVQVQISIGHAVYREARGHRRPAGGAIDFADVIDRIHSCINAVD